MFDFIKTIIIEFWVTVTQMSPYLLFGFLVAGALSVLVSQSLVEKHLGGRGLWPLLKASILGVPLPLCSCGVIPVSMSLHKHGASKGSTIAFLLSTPQTGVDSIFVTLSLLGPVFAVFRPIVALITGLIGGTIVDIFDPGGINTKNETGKCNDECCAKAGKTKKIINGLKYGFITLPRDIGKAMLIGLVVAALITALVPDDFFAEKFVGTGLLAMIIMMIVGIPAYVCATASVPIAAALIAKGLSPGAALVFLITGPATNAAGFITILKVLGFRTALGYIFTVVVCALGAGISLDIFFPSLSSIVQAHVHQMQPSIWGHIAAVVLLIVLALAIIRGKKQTKNDS